MELDLEARLIGETLVINRSLEPLNGYFIELNDLNEPFELRRNQGDDLMPTIEEGGVIEEFRTRDHELDTGIDDYPSYCDYNKKIHIDYAHNLKFSCMTGFEFAYANFFPLLYVNVMSKRFHNSIMKDKMVCKGNNVIGALMNVPIFVGTFYVMTDFVVLENIDAYRDEGMSDFYAKKLSFDEVKKLFETTMKRVNIFTQMKSDDTVPKVIVGSSKRDAEQELNHGCSKRQKIGEGSEPAKESKDKFSQEQLQQLMIIVPEEGMNVEALQTKYPIIDWEVYTSKTKERDILLEDHLK
ncbi:hypothetical protein Tco_1216603 [Tanacetum coccineum]